MGLSGEGGGLGAGMGVWVRLGGGGEAMLVGLEPKWGV